MREPYKYQKKIIDASVGRPYTMVQAACGTGKSLIAGQTAIRKGKPTLIITPKNIMEDFKAELMADGVPEKDIFVYSAAESHKEGYYEALEAWLKESIRKVENNEEEEDIVF
jgi:superfamily II DNA or RNA helicase